MDPGHSDAIARQGGSRFLSGLGPEEANQLSSPRLMKRETSAKRTLDGVRLRNRLSFGDTARWQGIRNVAQFMVAGPSADAADGARAAELALGGLKGVSIRMLKTLLWTS